MRLTRLGDLPPTTERVVIINVGTELVTTLAVLSALRYTASPVLVVNCDPTRESSEHFDHLAEHSQIEILEAPVQPHGFALDWLFAGIPSERVLLLDSDAELRTEALPNRMAAALNHPGVFGSGFIHGGSWLTGGRFGDRIAMFHERPWMPCVAFRTAHVRVALAAGVSFQDSTIFNDVRWSPRLSRLMGQRFGGLTRVPPNPTLQRLPMRWQDRLRASRLPWLAWARGDYYGERPHYVMADTGALMYEWCRHRRGLIFDGRPVEFSQDQVLHYGGVTRKLLLPGQRDAKQMVQVEDEVRSRLKVEYGVEWSELSDMARTGTATALPGFRARTRRELAMREGRAARLPPG